MNVPYDDLPLVPIAVAQHVCETPYTGAELANGPHQATIDKIESARQAMTQDDINRFALETDTRCRAAYEHQSETFFDRCANANGNRGRDQLIVYVTHWLAAFLMRQIAERPRPSEHQDREGRPYYRIGNLRLQDPPFSPVLDERVFGRYIVQVVHHYGIGWRVLLPTTCGDLKISTWTDAEQEALPITVARHGDHIVQTYNGPQPIEPQQSLFEEPVSA